MRLLPRVGVARGGAEAQRHHRGAVQAAVVEALIHAAASNPGKEAELPLPDNLQAGSRLELADAGRVVGACAYAEVRPARLHKLSDELVPAAVERLAVRQVRATRHRKQAAAARPGALQHLVLRHDPHLDLRSEDAPQAALQVALAQVTCARAAVHRDVRAGGGGESHRGAAAVLPVQFYAVKILLVPCAPVLGAPDGAPQSPCHRHRYTAQCPSARTRYFSPCHLQRLNSSG
mmetsp:Transcript_5830/g.14761  ORF Transcript_5830/g.14761 Transcript_5830/m.14761 type:complete len:233 (+) Transcript_5830:724-1422(+)